MKKKGEAFGGSQKKKTARINFNNPTLFGKQLRQNIQRFWVSIFLGGGNTEHCVAGLVLQFVRSDVKAKNEYLGWTIYNSNMINYECFCINRSMSMANSSFMHSIDTIDEHVTIFKCDILYFIIKVFLLESNPIIWFAFRV